MSETDASHEESREDQEPNIEFGTGDVNLWCCIIQTTPEFHQERNVFLCGFHVFAHFLGIRAGLGSFLKES